MKSLITKASSNLDAKRSNRSRKNSNNSHLTHISDNADPRTPTDVFVDVNEVAVEMIPLVSAAAGAPTIVESPRETIDRIPTVVVTIDEHAEESESVASDDNIVRG